MSDIEGTTPGGLDKKLPKMSRAAEEEYWNLKERDQFFERLENKLSGEPHSIIWNEIMSNMPRPVWLTVQNILLHYVKEKREGLQRKIDVAVAKPKRMTYKEKQDHYVRFEA
jgi:hypothetical protein